MPTHQSTAHIAAEIAARRLPAIFVDTCVALDIVRCVSRGKARVAALAAQLIDAQANGELLLYAHSVLQKEAARNRIEVEADAQRKARDIDLAMDQYRLAASHFGTAYPYPAGHVHAAVVPQLIALHDRFIAACTHVQPDPMNMGVAFARASDNRRPARKGGGANDCLMFEEFRRVAHLVPAADPLVLFTTNPDDFVDRAKGPMVVHQEIADDIAGTKAQVCFDWDWACHVVLSKARFAAI